MLLVLNKYLMDDFSESALDEFYRFSSGAARLINKVCAHCLIYGAQNGRRIIDDHMLKLVVQGELALQNSTAHINGERVVGKNG